jgi:hypothetical protein
MAIATIEAVVHPIVANQTKDAPLDISLNHERLLEETPRVDDWLATSEEEVAGTSMLYSRCGGSINQQLDGSDDANSQA